MCEFDEYGYEHGKIKKQKHVNDKIKKKSFLFCAILTLIFVSPFIYIKGLYDYVIIPQSAFIQISIILISVIFLFTRVIVKKPIHVLRHPLNLCVILFLVWTLISSFYALNSFEAFNRWIHWAACIMLFFMLQQIRLSSFRIYSILSVIYTVGTITAFIGICQYLFKIDFIPQSVPPAATFANKNMAAQFITLTFPLGIALFWKRDKTDILLGVSGTVIMSLFLIYTQTRAAWISVFFELVLIIIVLSIKSKFWKKNIISNLICILVILFFVGIPNWLNLGHKINKDSLFIRSAIYKSTVEMIKDSPIVGFGLGNHKVFYPKYQEIGDEWTIFSEQSQLKNVHNDFLQVFSETGVIGAIIILSVFGFFFREIIRILFYKNDDRFFVALGIGVATFGIIINSCFSFPFQMPIPPLIVSVYLAIALSLCRQNCFTRILYSDCFHIHRKYIILACLLPVLIYLPYYHYKNIKCDKYLLYAKFFEKKMNWELVINLANNAYDLNPHRKKFLSYSALGYIKTGKFQKAADDLEKVVKDYPYHMNAILNLGVAYGGLGQEEKAIKCYKRVLDIKPDYVKAYINIAVIHINRKEYDKAEEAFKKVLELDPDYFENK